MSRRDAAFDEATEALFELRVAFLSGRWAVREEVHERVWRLLGDVAYTLAVLQAETPRDIAEQACSFLPTDQEWREMLPRWKKMVDEGDFENGD